MGELTFVKHNNLFSYLGCNICKKSDSLTVSILTESFMDSVTLEDNVVYGEKPPYSLLRKYTEKMTSGLSYLHVNQHYHGNFHLRSVRVFGLEGLKICDFELTTSLLNMEKFLQTD